MNLNPSDFGTKGKSIGERTNYLFHKPDGMKSRLPCKPNAFLRFIFIVPQPWGERPTAMRRPSHSRGESVPWPWDDKLPRSKKNTDKPK